MIAAGTRPPRVTATMPCHGPSSMRRQASSLAWRCNSSQLTGNILACDVMVALNAGNSSPLALLIHRHENAVELPPDVGLQLHYRMPAYTPAITSTHLHPHNHISIHLR